MNNNLLAPSRQTNASHLAPVASQRRKREAVARATKKVRDLFLGKHKSGASHAAGASATAGTQATSAKTTQVQDLPCEMIQQVFLHLDPYDALNAGLAHKATFMERLSGSGFLRAYAKGYPLAAYAPDPLAQAREDSQEEPSRYIDAWPTLCERVSTTGGWNPIPCDST
jgi:hypothetical protein